MRTYGRTYAEDGTYTWTLVQTDANGFNDYVWATTLIQVLLLNLGESPFYAGYGIPAQQSVIQQLFPDLYVAKTQQLFAQYFASLIISKVANPEPTYNVNIVTNVGVKVPTLNIPAGGNFN